MVEQAGLASLGPRSSLWNFLDFRFKAPPELAQ